MRTKLCWRGRPHAVLACNDYACCRLRRAPVTSRVMAHSEPLFTSTAAPRQPPGVLCQASSSVAGEMEEAAPAVEGAPGAAAPKPQAAGGLTPLMLERSVKQIEFYFSDSNLPRDKFLLDKVHSSPAGWVELGLVATFERMRELLKARHGCCANLPHCCSARCLRPAGRTPVSLGATDSCCRRRLAPVSSPCPAPQITAPRIPPATIAALAQALRTSAPSLVGASLAYLPLPPPPLTRCSPRPCVCVRLPPVSDDGKSVRRTQPLAAGEEETINKAVEARSLYAAPFPYDATLDSASDGLAALTRVLC